MILTDVGPVDVGLGVVTEPDGSITVSGVTTVSLLGPQTSMLVVRYQSTAPPPPTTTTTTTTTTTPSPDDTDDFTDDDGHLFEGDINAIAAADITRGCNPPGNDRFCPDDYVTRGQMAAFLTRALGLTAPPGDTFTDDDGSVFETDIEALAAADITRGCNPPLNDRFCSGDYVTRGQMAAFLNRALLQP